jgi:putative hemolysin
MWLLLTLGVILVLVALAAAFACSETVLFSLSPLQIQNAAASNIPLRRLAAQLMRAPRRTLMVILLGNTAVNVLIFATLYLTFRHMEWLGSAGPVLSAVLSIFLVVVAGEVVPKVVGVSAAERLAPLAAGGLRFVSLVLGPLARAIEWALVLPTERVLWGARWAEPTTHALSTSELKALLDLSRRRGVIDPTEDVLLREVVDLHELRVRDVMVPRVEVIAYDVNGSPAGLRELMRTTRRKKVPVYQGTVDNIIGLVYAKVLFLSPDRPLRELVQPVVFIPEIVTCEQLLVHFRKTRAQLAITVDEYGGMAGLVTLEDVLEQIVGEIRGPDEQPSEPEIVRRSETEYEISGTLGVHYWAQTFGMPRLAERVATVGGLVTARLGRPARVGDRVRLANIELEVLQARPRRVDRLRVRLLGESELPAEALA